MPWPQGCRALANQRHLCEIVFHFWSSSPILLRFVLGYKKDPKGCIFHNHFLMMSGFTLKPEEQGPRVEVNKFLQCLLQGVPQWMAECNRSTNTRIFDKERLHTAIHCALFCTFAFYEICWSSSLCYECCFGAHEKRAIFFGFAQYCFFLLEIVVLSICSFILIFVSFNPHLISSSFCSTIQSKMNENWKGRD